MSLCYGEIGMKPEKRTVILGRWILAATKNGVELLENQYVVVEGSSIAAVTKVRPAAIGLRND